MKPANQESSASNGGVLSDIQTLRNRARQNIEEGAVTAGYAADREMIAYLSEHDPTTQRMLKEILSCEEEHAEDLASLLESTKR